MDELSDEDFADLCADAAWMHSQQIQYSMAGMLGGVAAKGVSNQPAAKKPIRRKR